MADPKIHLHHNDLPANVDLGNEIAVDTELMGLNIHRDRLCLVQLRGRNADIHLVKIAKGQKEAPHLKKQLENKKTLKIFHYARADFAWLKHWLGIDCSPLFCTKIASRLTRTYGNFHGLKDLSRDLLDIELSKQQQLTNWGVDTLTPEQITYAASDVLHLHELMDKLKVMLEREDRTAIAQACFDFVPTRAALDILGWEETDIFAHS